MLSCPSSHLCTTFKSSKFDKWWGEQAMFQKDSWKLEEVRRHVHDLLKTAGIYFFIFYFFKIPTFM